MAIGKRAFRGGTVRCADKFRNALCSKADYAELTGNGGTEVVHPRRMSIEGFRGFVARLQLEDPTAAAGPNAPTELSIYGHATAGSSSGDRTLIERKNLTGVTDWSGFAFLEIDNQHINDALAERANDGVSRTDGNDIDFIEVGFKAPAGSYIAGLEAWEPVFKGSQYVQEEFVPETA